MKVLFDQGTPVPLRRSLPGHTVDTAFELGWATLRNGDLLNRASALARLAVSRQPCFDFALRRCSGQAHASTSPSGLRSA